MAQTPAGQSTSPQLVPRTPEQRERTREANRRINLHVIVTDASGKSVAGLKPEDFTVLDHGQPQTVTAFEEVNNAANGSTRGLLVLDAINGGASGVHRVGKELFNVLAQGQGPLPYPLQIVVVSSAGAIESPPTSDRNALAADVTRLTRNLRSADCDSPGAGQNLLEFPSVTPGGPGQAQWNCQDMHLMKSLNALNALAQAQQKVNARAIVIWTGPGWPLPPQLDSGQIIPGGGTTGDLSKAIVTLEAAMQQGRITLDALSWESFARAAGVRRTGLRGSLAGASLPEQEAALELPALAAQTGGLALEKSKDLAAALNTCLGDGEQYYSIAFDPAPASSHDEYRTIEVKVDRPGASVRTLAGYYAQP